MKNLLVLTNGFPYGTWEPYMETEEKYYVNFDKVWIASLQLRDAQSQTCRKLDSGATVIPVKYKTRLFYFFNCFTILFDKALYREIFQLFRDGRFTFFRLVDIFVFLSRSYHEARVIDKVLKNENKSDIVLYSYRFEYQPYVAVLLKRKWKSAQQIVSRAHGYDLYEERHHSNYIPFRKEILNNVAHVFPCSQHGVRYILEKYENFSAKVEPRYLGTVDHGFKCYQNVNNKFKIVSCSNVVTVKRLHKIVNALSLIDDIDIEWTHFGDGPLMDSIKSLALKKLGNNIKAIFPGNIANQNLLQEYASKDFYLFINVSQSEGIPVSIMEAMSFGIPCIATDVGGTHEIVNRKNGVLLSADVDDSEIADTIRKMCLLTSDEYALLRKRTRLFWEEHFNSDKNYLLFVRELLQL